MTSGRIGLARMMGTNPEEVMPAVFLTQGHMDLAHNAQIVLQNALGLLDPSMKRRQPTLSIDLAGVSVQQGDIEQACGYAMKAVDIIKSIHSKIVLQRLLTLRDSLNAWKGTRYVQELDECMKPLLASGKY